MGLAIIGPEIGPSRFFTSTDPRERLRVSNANCALASMMRWERYASASAAQRLWDAVISSCTKNDLMCGDKRDWITLAPAALVQLVERTARRHAVLLITPELKQDAIFRAQQDAVDSIMPREWFKQRGRKKASSRQPEPSQTEPSRQPESSQRSIPLGDHSSSRNGPLKTHL